MDRPEITDADFDRAHDLLPMFVTRSMVAELEEIADATGARENRLIAMALKEWDEAGSPPAVLPPLTLEALAIPASRGTTRALRIYLNALSWWLGRTPEALAARGYVS